MSGTLPAYNWELHKAVHDHLEIFSTILGAIRTDSKIPPSEDGYRYIDIFYSTHVPPAPGAQELPPIDMQPLVGRMLRDSRAYAGLCAMRAENIVTYLENMSVMFSGKKWSDQVDGEIAARGIEIQTLKDDLRTGRAVYGSEKMPYHDMTIYSQGLGGVEHALFCHDELVQSRLDGRDYILPDYNGLKPVFNFAGRQVALSLVTQRYAVGAAALSESTMQVLLGITTMPPAQQSLMSARMYELQAMAEHLLIAADLALDEGARLARDAYRATEYGRPVFRAEPLPPSRQYPGLRPR